MRSIETFDTPGLFHEGVLYIEGKPLYIVEYYNEDGLETYVSVYDVAEESKKEDAPEEAIRNPRKAYEVRKETRGFRPQTFLSKLAAEKYKSEEVTREVIKPPVFTAPIEYGRDTFYDIEGMGFFERTRDMYVKKEGKVIAEGGIRTGVFIALDSIMWKRHYVPTSEVLNQYRARLSIWSDFL